MNYYLRADVKIEPLVAGWHAHPYLVSPPSAALMLRHHIKIMESFVSQPEMHKMALGESRMRNGPFFESQRFEDVSDVRSLLEQTVSSHGDLLEMASEIDELVELLKTAKGECLDKYYKKLGRHLAGRIELLYEASGRATFRFYEALFYKSYPPHTHQEFALSRLTSDTRPFVMSNPRLSGRYDLILRMPFNSEEAGALLNSRLHPVSKEWIDTWFNMQGKGLKWSREQIEDLFICEESKRSEKPKSNELHIDYIGHACVHVNTGSESILIDPLFGYKVPGAQPRMTVEDLPSKIDCAVITHAHHDHYVLEGLLQIRDRIETLVVPRSNPGNILDPSLGVMSRHLGFKKVLEPGMFETIELESCRIQTIPFPGEHADLDISSKLGFRFEMDDLSMIFVADSNNHDPRLYEQIHDIYGPTDIAFIGLECIGAPAAWSYGPLILNGETKQFDRSRRTGGSNSKRGIELVKALGCRRVFIYAIAIEPWMSPFGGARIKEGSMQDHEILSFISECNVLDIQAELLDGSKLISL